MSSNVFITIEAEGVGGAKVRRTIDLYHIYLLLVYQIYNALTSMEGKDRGELSLEKIDLLKISLPINAKAGHQAFMQHAFETVFNPRTGRRPNYVPVQVTTEPEAAFNFIATDSEQAAAFDAFDHAVLIDGGDGTFDYLYV